MNKHIHGPLRLIQDSEAWFILDRAGWAVCEIGKWPQSEFAEETRAYANLFFKAYEMLEALKAILNDALCVIESAETDSIASMVAVDMQDLGRLQIATEQARILIAELEDE